MSKNSLSILYITKKQNAIAPLASILRHAFPKLTASQTASPEEIHNFKDLDIIIADDEFKIKTDLPILGVVPIEKAEEYARQRFDFVTENEVSSYAIARAVKDILERKKLTQELKEASIKDELTGLYNQKFLLETLARETKKATRYSYPLTLLYIGIDSLRKINSKYGHEIGDRVLVDFGLIATNSVREVDTIGRYSGDEFLAMLPETSSLNSIRVCERIQNAVKNFAFVSGEAGLTITAGIGMAELSTSIRTKEELLNAARQALAGAKKRGASSICTYEEAKLIDEPTKENRDLITAVSSQITMLTDEARKNHFLGILKIFTEMPLYRKMLSHLEHVSFYSERLAAKMGLTGEELALVRNSALIHDIGKLAIDERIILKNGPLTSTEYAIVKQHPVFAAQMLSGSIFIKNEINTILHHHEHFDGNGYPDHMQGTHIPVASRIIHLAESWDAMITAQDYRPALPLDQALNELKKGAGKEFDPELVAIFTGLIEN